MPYNPQIHNRRSIRLKEYDYSQAGLYLITICTQGRICRFGMVENGKMVLNEYGQIAYNEWSKLPKRFTNFKLDAFQIMPNHIHGIIVLNDDIGAGFTPALTMFTPAQNVANDTQNVAAQNDADTRNNEPRYRRTKNGQSRKGQPRGLPLQPTIGNIIGAYKSLVANGCLDILKSKNKTLGKLWQRNYYEHIIRNEQSYQTIFNYIIHNPEKWAEDKYYE
jgi:putative transposase